MSNAIYINFPAQAQVTVEEENVATGDLGPDDVLIRNETSIISAGTELARLHGLDSAVEFPARPGYGCIGVIEAIGSNANGFQVGDRVFYAGKHCSLQRFTHNQDHQWGYLFPVKHDIDPIDAVMVCMAQIAFTGPHLSDINAGDSVAVFGLGLVGNFAAQFYKLLGARVIGIDPASKRCELAKECGIKETLDCPPAEQIERLKALTNNEGAEITVDAVGHSALVSTAVNCTRIGGQVVLLGTPRAAMDGNLTDAFHTIHSNLLTVRGAHMWCLPLQAQRGVKKSVEWAFNVVLDHIANGSIQVRPLISHILKPSEVPEAYVGLKERPNEYIGAVIDWR